jgi:hypothetical protein
VSLLALIGSIGFQDTHPYYGWPIFALHRTALGAGAADIVQSEPAPAIISRSSIYLLPTAYYVFMFMSSFNTTAFYVTSTSSFSDSFCL